MVESLGGSQSDQVTLVTILSVSNFVGRFLFGLSSDFFGKRFAVMTRVMFFNIPLLFMGLSHLFLANSGYTMLFVGVGFVGISYGGVWAL